MTAPHTLALLAGAYGPVLLLAVALMQAHS